MKKNLYLLLAIVGLILPYYFLVRFLSANGVDLQLMLGQLFVNDISAFFAIDLILSIAVFCLFVPGAADRLKLRNGWLFVLAALTVGLSFALPLFLYFREGAMESSR
ncbi:MAG TPA: DUF2834 domain-containing protein [Anaerolineales bacterium]|jgi:hypothetical protein